MDNNTDQAYHSQNASSTYTAMMGAGRLVLGALLAVSQIPTLENNSNKGSENLTLNLPIK